MHRVAAMRLAVKAIFVNKLLCVSLLHTVRLCVTGQQLFMYLTQSNLSVGHLRDTKVNLERNYKILLYFIFICHVTK